jgi:hypothetical protein
MAQGRESEGEALRDQAFEEAGDTPGMRDEAKFAWVADIDPRLGPCFEAIVGGRWGLIPFEAVDVIKVDGPNDLRDVVWLPVQIMLRSGQSAAALLPARYPGTETETDSDLRLGRKTEWRNGAGPEASGRAEGVGASTTGRRRACSPSAASTSRERASRRPREAQPHHLRQADLRRQDARAPGFRAAPTWPRSTPT